jgi:RNA binding exosome subunit
MLDIFISSYVIGFDARGEKLSQLPIAYVDIRFCAHATEDIDKVMQAVQNVLPSEQNEEIVFNRSNCEGHYGNSITFFETRVKNKEIIKVLVENLSASLSSLDKDELGRTINRCVEKGSLYLRIDKQAAFQGKIKFVTSDPIRIRIRFRKSKLEDVTEICREIGMLT